MKFSKSTGFFYDELIHGSAIPNDAVDVTETERDALLAAEQSGLQIVGDVDGNPIAVERVVSLTDAQNYKRTELKTAVSSAIIAGIESDVLGASHFYPTGVTDQANLNGLVTESLLPGAGDEYKFWSRDSAGLWMRRTHSKSQIQALGLAVVSHVKSQQQIYESKLAAVNAAVDIAGVDAVIW